MIWAVMGKTVLTLSERERERDALVLITGYFQAMICLAGMGSFLLSLPALQSVTLILTMLIRKLSLSSAKAGQFLGFLQKKLCIYYHLFTRSEGKKSQPSDGLWLECSGLPSMSSLILSSHSPSSAPSSSTATSWSSRTQSKLPPSSTLYSCLVLLFSDKLTNILLIFQINPIIYWFIKSRGFTSNNQT